MERLRLIAQRVLIALGAVLAVGFLFWTPAPDEPDDGRTHIRYWYIVGAEDDVPYHARRFNEVQDAIVVHATPIPWTEHERKILTAVLSGDPPDVVSQFIPVVKWASRLALTPLDGFLAASGLDTTAFYPALWREMTWQGQTFALPVNSTSYALFYNKRLFRAAGLDPEDPPETWDELEAAAERLTDRDARGRIVQAGFVPDYGNLPTTQLMAWQQGVAYLSPDGATVHLDTPEVRQAMGWLADYYAAYGVDDLKTFTAGLGTAEQHGFLSGKLGMAVLDLSFLDQLATYAPDLDYGVAPIPTFPGRPSASSAGSWWLAIPRGARHPEAAWAFLRFATARETQLAEAEASSEALVPANRLAAEDPAFLSTPALRVFADQMAVAHSPTVVPLAHDVFWREFFGAQERVLFGLQTPAEALAQAEAVVQDALDRARAYDDYVHATVDLDVPGG
ncbi:MAG: ABC transporter substrate-binding protein [Rubricoccaceae bacterium]|nr:ABC transporter substrate-binding protein [Rubricoccaceae bacterium]